MGGHSYYQGQWCVGSRKEITLISLSSETPVPCWWLPTKAETICMGVQVMQDVGFSLPREKLSQVENVVTCKIVVILHDCQLPATLLGHNSI